MKSIKAHLQQRKPGGGLLGAELAQLTKAATAKNVAQPDEELMTAVTTAVNTSSESSAAQQMRDVLHKRLMNNNPHKVWLATVLTDKVLKDCADIIAPVRSDLFQDLAEIAGKPLDRYQENFKDEQRAKMHAFGVLRSSGRQAQSILRHTCKIGRMVNLTAPDNKTRRTKKEDASTSQSTSRSGTTPSAAASSGSAADGAKTSKMSWDQVKGAVQTSLGVADSHTQMIQDLVHNIINGKSTEPEFERQFLGELVEEVISFRGAFEQLLSSFSTFKQDTAPLVKKSLEAIEEMNKALELYRTKVAHTGDTAAPPSVRSASLTGSRSRLPGARGSTSVPHLSGFTRSRSGPLESLKGVGEALPASSGGTSSTRPDKDRSRRDNHKASVPRSNSGRLPAAASRQEGAAGYCPPAVPPKQASDTSTTNQQQSTPTAQQQQQQQQQQQTSFMQAPQQPLYFPPQQHHQQQQQLPQQLQHSGSGSGGWASQMNDQLQHSGSGSGGWASQMSAGDGGSMPGFIPMPQSMQGYQGGGPVLYMPVMGPNGQQGFAPVYQPQQAPQSSFPPGASVSHGSYGEQQHQGQQQWNHSAANAAAQGNPFAQPPQALASMSSAPASFMAAPNSPNKLAPSHNPPHVGSQPGSLTWGAESQKPAPITRHSQPTVSATAKSSDPFSDLGQLEAPYTPAAASSSNAGFAAPSATSQGSSSAFSTLPPTTAPSSRPSHPQTESTATKGNAGPVLGGGIPDPLSAGSGIFPAKAASRAQASTGLTSFPASSAPTGETSTKPLNDTWNPPFPNTTNVPAKEGSDMDNSKTPVNLLV